MSRAASRGSNLESAAQSCHEQDAAACHPRMTLQMDTSWLLVPLQRALPQPAAACQPSLKLPTPHSSRSELTRGCMAPPGMMPQCS
jgi:hypothetical protein